MESSTTYLKISMENLKKVIKLIWFISIRSRLKYLREIIITFLLLIPILDTTLKHTTLIWLLQGPQMYPAECVFFKQTVNLDN